MSVFNFLNSDICLMPGLGLLLIRKLCMIFPDTWGDAFPIANPNWDLVIASDILLCKCIPL